MPTLFTAVQSLALLIVLMTIAWAASLRHRNLNVVDVMWGPAFALVGWLYAIRVGNLRLRPLLLAILVTVWGVRLAAHVHARRRSGVERPRYAAMRRRQNAAFWWRSLLLVCWPQAAIIWFIALPLLTAAQSVEPAGTTLLDVIGSGVFLVGLAVEAIADYQLARFRCDPRNRGRVLDAGLWRYSRHPNYFGDALVWWGVYAIVSSTPTGWLTFLSPMTMTFLLLQVSGVTVTEEHLQMRPGYRDYAERTSAFVPWPPLRRR